VAEYESLVLLITASQYQHRTGKSLRHSQVAQTETGKRHSDTGEPRNKADQVEATWVVHVHAVRVQRVAVGVEQGRDVEVTTADDVVVAKKDTEDVST
jgi:hypothetical protein